MSEEKLKILKEIYKTDDLETLKCRSIINLNSREYNNMDDEEFVTMVLKMEEKDNDEIYDMIEERINSNSEDEEYYDLETLLKYLQEDNLEIEIKPIDKKLKFDDEE